MSTQDESLGVSVSKQQIDNVTKIGCNIDVTGKERKRWLEKQGAIAAALKALGKTLEIHAV